MLNKENILKSISKVPVPDLKRDLVTLNMIENLEIIGEIIRFDLVFSTPASPLQEKIKEDCMYKTHPLFGYLVGCMSSRNSHIVYSQCLSN